MVRVEIPVPYSFHVSLTWGAEAVLAQTYRVTVTGWFKESSVLSSRETKTRSHAKRLHFSVHSSFQENYCLPFYFSIFKITAGKNDSWLCLSSSDHPTSNATSRESSTGNRHKYSHRNKIRYEQGFNSSSNLYLCVHLKYLAFILFSHLVMMFGVCI